MERGAVHRFELIPLADGAWRLCDRSFDADDPAGVVAYVEETSDGVEVVWLQGRLGRETFPVLGDVLIVAEVDITPMRRSRSRRPVEIPHIAPQVPADGA